jgi:hypothetical protein
MKSLHRFNLQPLAFILCLSLSACGYQPRTQFGRNVAAWWGQPGTQQGVAVAEQAAMQFAVNAGLAALQAYAGGGKINLQQIAVQGGISTLYQQASNIRQLQGTAQVLDPVATAQLLQQGGTPEEISRKLAQQLFDNATALIVAGASPNQAAEVNASGLDQAAVIVKTSVNNP